MFIPRIVISGDILRPRSDGLPDQAPNIRWLYNLIRYPLTLAVKDTRIEPVIWDVTADSIDGARVYALNGLQVNWENWARLFDARELSLASIQYIRSFYENSLVLAFELPSILIRVFDYLGIDYVDLSVHPARFLDDCFFGIRTSIPETFDVLRRHALAREVLYIQAGIHKATVSRMRQPEIESNSCLCVGQSRVDKSLISEGKILSLLNFVDELKRISASYRRMYYKPHPYVDTDEDVVRALMEFGNVEITHENIYKLLCHESIKEVVGISSSAIFEASFFDKKATFLHKTPLKLWEPESGNQFDRWTFVPIYDDVFSPRFWSELLASRCRVNGCPDIKLPQKTSRLRISLQAHWGYNSLDYEILLKNMIGETA